MTFHPTLIVAAALSLSISARAADTNAADTKSAGATKAQVCFSCHGPNGNSQNGMYPVLAGQTARYLYLELRDFKAGRRKNPVMSPMAANLSKEDMHDLADYFAAQKPTPLKFKPDPQRVAAGAKKADQMLCSMCHLGGLKGQNEIPRLAGQQPDYVVAQLKAFKAHERTNDGGNMQSVAQTLSDDDMLNLAHYIASLY